MLLCVMCFSCAQKYQNKIVKFVVKGHGIFILKSKMNFLLKFRLERERMKNVPYKEVLPLCNQKILAVRGFQHILL